MLSLSLLQILYIVLILFTCIIGTLVTLILIKVLRLMEAIDEVLYYYGKVKQVIGFYATIPNVVKQKIKEFF